MKLFNLALLIVLGTWFPCPTHGKANHIGIDVSKAGEIMVASSGGAQVGHTIVHQTFPNCVLVNCQRGSLHVAPNKELCQDANTANQFLNEEPYCAVLTDAIRLAGIGYSDEDEELDPDDDSLAHISTTSIGATVKSNSKTGQLSYEIQGSPFHVSDVVNTLLSHVIGAQELNDATTTSLMIPYHFSYGQREAIIHALHQISHEKLTVVEVLRFNTCTIHNENTNDDVFFNPCKTTKPLKKETTENEPDERSDQVSLDWAVFKRVQKLQDVKDEKTSSCTDKTDDKIDEDTHDSPTINIVPPPIRFDTRASRPTVQRIFSFLTVAPRPYSLVTPTGYGDADLERNENRIVEPMSASSPKFHVHPTKTPTKYPSKKPAKHTTTTHFSSTGTSDTLTAGEWNDLNSFAFWRSLVNCGGERPQCWKQVQRKWKLCTSHPIQVKLVGQDICGKSIKIFSDSDLKMKGDGKTNSNGTATVFLKIDDEECSWNTLDDDRLGIEINKKFIGIFETNKLMKNENGIPTIQIVMDENEKKKSNEKVLDLMFVTDATGSMGDEIEFLQSDLQKLIGHISMTCQKNEPSFRIRTSVNFYRDIDDEYVVKSFPFDEDIEENVKRVASQSAAGGGDFPEAVHVALDDAMFGHRWSPGDGVTKLMLLILDAPPHDGREVEKSLAKSLKRAQKMGVRIVPVTGSGIDKETEFLMRSFSILSGGTYVHLTDDSGVGLKHLETKKTIPPHDVRILFDVLVDVVRRYVACQ